ncbi:hypothetical protein GCM10015535_32580 [Streptomyces gelaticus]|uniref:Uncharacterized protein n=1 Tax=Streptomyces gelaticus TaxID=285446 RepID=A0ABQ2W1U8_9ACTN|nr:hypothetical protein [Streptomyces gelaticus]GGV85636.1 hypothetical protein GCM10015535_32580 [Streptomyces gelaticus]
MADTRLLVALIPHDAVRSRIFFGDPLSMLRNGESDHLPVALGGGRQGYTDFRDTGVALNCTNMPASLVVAVRADKSHENAAKTRRIAQLATATAERASAACGTGPRALFTADGTEYAASPHGPPHGYLRTALRAFAERAAQRHGCTDLKLPS